MLFFNGIDGATGRYDLPPMTTGELAAYILGAKLPDDLDRLREKHRREAGGLETLGPVDGVDVRDLASAGWGVVFAKDTDPAVMEALSELIALRREQAGDLFRLYSGGEGVAAGESKSAWLGKRGVGPGPANPKKVPYYLLLVGSPEEIPFRFQTQLDVDYAVGRIHFDTPEEYASYAAGVARAETGAGRALARHATFFGVTNGDDPATTQTTGKLVQPLFQLGRQHPDWTSTGRFGTEASKAALTDLMGGAATPSILFTGSHGLSLPNGHAHQLRHQGALVCSEWPGPNQWAGPIPQKFFLAGEDLSSDADLSGLIACFYACFGGGTPLTDDFVRQSFNDRPAQIAPVPFLADLPRRMLSRPRGGALAVIGHVERVWNCSYEWPGVGPQIDVFESFLRQLLNGYPVGAAVEFFNSRYAGLTTLLADLLERIDHGEELLPEDLAFHWTASNDARGNIIIGDPAVRSITTHKEPAQSQDHLHVETRGPAMNSQSPTVPEPVATTSDSLPVITDSASDARPASGNGHQPADLFAMSPPPGLDLPDDYQVKHPELYAAWTKHVQAGYEYNDQIFRRILDAFLQSHRSTLVMYWIVFGVGIAAFVAAVVTGITQQNAPLTALFGGLTIVSFVTYFIGRPTQSVEENLQYVTWLGIIYNTYWTRLSWAVDPETAPAVLDMATAEAITQLKELSKHHGKAVKGRPNLDPTTESDSGSDD
jgi:hypothetical protein